MLCCDNKTLSGVLGLTGWGGILICGYCVVSGFYVALFCFVWNIIGGLLTVMGLEILFICVLSLVCLCDLDRFYNEVFIIIRIAR